MFENVIENLFNVLNSSMSSTNKTGYNEKMVYYSRDGSERNKVKVFFSEIDNVNKALSIIDRQPKKTFWAERAANDLKNNLRNSVSNEFETLQQ
jgi:hypothetical protein